MSSTSATSVRHRAACPVCGSSHGRAGAAPLWICQSCGHGDASATVSSGEVRNEPPNRVQPRPSRLHRSQLRLAQACGAAGVQVVDVGCANGAFLRHAIDTGFAGPSSYGVEVSEANAATARSIDLRVESAVGAVEPGALVTFWHSAEHFAVGPLVELWRDILVRSDGRASLLISVPNGRSLQARAFGQRWAFHDPEAHLSAFSEVSLTLLLGQAGYRPARWFRTPVYGVFSAAQSALNLVRPRNELYEALKRGSAQLDRRARWSTLGAAVVTAPVAALACVPEVSPRWASVLTLHAVAE